MGLFSWFSKSSPPDYETLFSRLSAEIEESKTHLAQIRLRERRWNLLVSAYGVAIWAIWVGLWWIRALPLRLVGLDGESVHGRAIGMGGIAAGPFLIWSLNRAIHFILQRQRNSSEHHLRDALTKQRKHLEDIKKATNYDSTRKLIERYDDSLPPSPITPHGTPFGTPQRGSQGIPPSQPGTPNPVTPKKAGKGSKAAGGPGPGPSTPRAPGHLNGAGGTPLRLPEGLTQEQAAALQMQMQAVQPVLPTPDKKWYDRVVDSILGEDPAQSSQSKYALVCGECFRHNGLVGSKYEWGRMQWICPRCNHINPPPISRSHDSGLPPKSSSSSTASSSSSSKAPLSFSPSPALESSDTPAMSSLSIVPVPATGSAPAAPSPAPLTPSHLSRSSPRRRLPVERGTPQSSKLGQEVFSASLDDDDEDEYEENHFGEDDDEGQADRDRMDVDRDT